MKLLCLLLIAVAATVANENLNDCSEFTAEQCIDIGINDHGVHYYAHPYNCHKFYKVEGGKACLSCCPLIHPDKSNRLVFNPESGMCDWPFNVRNPAGNCNDVNQIPQSINLQTTIRVNCPERGTSFVKDDKDCTRYYKCVNGTSKGPFRCMEGTVFNPVIQACDIPGNSPSCNHSK
ncbi:protein obstructor-E-like [Frieseomelitta varia]|uniref:protein obstructor-E-like n=1 Tax=Frieseomelitta varia TaxID=561572 RepID=UPI001CB68FAA|nr:protein obstructor-E-like [Frieseomelitta varia]